MPSNPVTAQPTWAIRGGTPDDAFDAIRGVARQLKTPILSGQMLTVTGTGPQDVTVAHGLQRTPQGWFVSRERGAIAAAPFESQAPDAVMLYLRISGTGAFTFDIWVF